MKTKNFIIVILFFLCNHFLWAWGITGHRVIAEIGEKHLHRKVKKEVMNLLDGKPMAYWANWPDEIKSDSLGIWKPTYSWHYINLPTELNYSQFVDVLTCSMEPNLYSAIHENLHILRDKTYTKEKRKIALIFIIHLMGDLHQPLHLGCKEDLGGNKITLTWFSNPTNLHAVWDSELIDYFKYSYTEYAKILNNSKIKNSLTQGSLEDWFYDSYYLSQYVYKEFNKFNKNLYYSYTYYNKEILEQQLLKGGLRLAQLLNTYL